MFRTLIMAGTSAALLALLFCGSRPLPAQDGVLGQAYGSGVHAYFAGDYIAAYEDLSAAIEGGTTDPRAYYFRALASTRLGREEEARDDLRRGAELEISDARDLYPVARSLERIQGRPRLMIERYREQARMAAHQRRQEERVQRYGRSSRSTARPVQPGPGATTPAPIRTDGAAPVKDTIAPPEAVAPIAGGDAPVDQDPFAAPAAEEKPSTQPALTTDVAPEDPLGAPAREAPAEVVPAEKPEAEMPAEDDPLGAPAETDTPAADDPFGAPATKPDADDPFGAPAEKPEADDPFGAPAAAPATEMPAEDSATDDPFGAPAEIAPESGDVAPATDDPFGAPAAAPAKPAEAEPAADPFGAPAAEMPEEGAASGADATADPFGAPAEEASAADPFGAPADAAPAADPFGAPASGAPAAKPAAKPTPTNSGAGATKKGSPGAVGSLFRALTKGPREAISSARSAIPVGGQAAMPPGAQQTGPAAEADPFGQPEPNDATVDPFADDPGQQ